MTTEDTIQGNQERQPQRRRPFTTWVKKLTNFKHSSDPERNKRHAKPRRGGKLNNPYPESGTVSQNHGNRHRYSEHSFATHQTGDTSIGGHSGRYSVDLAPPTAGGRSMVGTVSTDNDTARSITAPSHGASSLTGTSRTLGGGVESRRGGDSTFSSPAPSWKSFDFFDVSQVAPPEAEATQLFEGNDVSSVCAGSDSLFIGSGDGSVSILGKNWKVLNKFQAHDAGQVTQMRQVEGTSVLVTVAEDLSNEPVLKAWALDKLVKKTNMPTCLSTITISNGRRQFPISAFAALDDLSQIAVGFANGAVTVIRGDLIHDLGTKQRIVYESEEPVTGVQLMEDEKLTTLFVSTTSRILKLGLSKRGQGLPPKTVEDSGCAVGCMTLDPVTGDIVVARDDAIYTYNMDGRGPPKVYESPKKMIAVHQDYMALACPPASSYEPDSIRRRFTNGADGLFDSSTFVLLEPDLRIIAHTETLISPVKFIFEVWGDIFTVTEQGKAYRYHEKPLQQRLDMIYQRNMFPLALELARNSGMDNKEQSAIYRKFGDHLYQKADYDGSMNQYIRAIDTTEPSQVIRKFLDTQRIHNLIRYLEELHDHRKATADHTTLLLNCYAKLKDKEKLEKFIESPGDLKFDLDTAISMCRQGGYYEQAAYLAKKHGETELVVDILIEDSKNYAAALEYIWHQDPAIAYPCLRKYARVLIEHCPQQATKLFSDYYTGRYRPKRTPIAVVESAAHSSNTFTSGAASAVQNLSNLFALPYISPASVTDTPGSAMPTVEGLPLDEDDYPPPKYTPPEPRTAFSSFIDHADEFIIFLEACLEESNIRTSDQTDLYTTLFEMYLYKAGEKKGLRREEWEAKAKKLIEGEHVPMESSNVLLLSHLSNFKDGTVLVKEQAGLLSDIFRSYTSARDTQGAMKALRKYGPDEPQLYPAALAYLTSDPKILEEAGQDELAGILAKIDKDGLMAPLQVIQTLVGQSAGGGFATMGMIKPYLQETITRERRQISSNRHRIKTLRTDTEKRRVEIEELNSKPAIFQATRCTECGQGLDLPTVHFLCKHSFHERCLRSGTEEDAECPKCATNNDMIRKIRRGQQEEVGKHELFKSALERSEDKFGTIAEWFSHGVMDASQNAEHAP
ncbi:vacuolar protein sorting protein [Akanthomyces lecanii RCEF 1005]|uniref:Vacuolar protein sorting protein n=1 Tax=Akanthomyces lecanii RCEF 1005 TaxID=1081108 RepID=A0A162IV33_CORDF|nr:vacuolar protein sorting protein [Akanthomyces lecanii RCEF 1005]